MSTPLQAKQWREKNKEHVRAYEALRREQPEYKRKKAERDKRYKLANKDKVKAWKKVNDKLYRQRYPEKVKELNRQWRLNNPSIQRSRIIKGTEVKFGHIDPRLISNYRSKVCGICGLIIESLYEIDHIIPISRNGTHELDNLQLTHPICNRTKHNKLQNEMALDIIVLREYLK
jgi:5-methylcytosine-specific restriction endonuclease McrA